MNKRERTVPEDLRTEADPSHHQGGKGLSTRMTMMMRRKRSPIPLDGDLIEEVVLVELTTMRTRRKTSLTTVDRREGSLTWKRKRAVKKSSKLILKKPSLRSTISYWKDRY